MNGLFRDLAPITSDAWEEIDKEARRTLKSYLAARKLVDFTGPLGWAASAVNLGRFETLSEGPVQHVEARLRRVQPLVEVRVPFELSRAELDTIDRGSQNADLQPLIDAARHAALAEDHAVFNGYAPAGIEGIGETAAGSSLTVTTDYLQFPATVAEAKETLRTRGIDGPYAIALGPRCYTGLQRTFTSGGYPVMENVRRMLDGPVVWAPAIDGAVVLSLRGGDFELSVGQDFSIGYLAHDATTVQLYIQESFTFQPHTPEAVAVPLRYAENVE